MTTDGSSYLTCQFIEINDLNADLVDVSAWIESWVLGDTLRLFKIDDSSQFGIYEIDAAPDNAGGSNNYYLVGLSPVDGNGSFGVGHNIVISHTITGTQGAQGAQGVQGTQGAAGSAGSQGPQGVQGTQGTAGSAGSQGPQGAQGTQGTAGSAGSQGPQGAQGTQGVQGTQGTAGSAGSQGPQGVQGTQGTGTQGPQGTQGESGIYGGASSHWTYDDVAYTTNNPDSGEILTDSGTFTSITEIEIHDDNADSVDVYDWKETWKEGDTIRMWVRGNTEKFGIYTLDDNATDNHFTTYHSLSLTNISGANSMTDGDEIVVSHTKNAGNRTFTKLLYIEGPTSTDEYPICLLEKAVTVSEIRGQTDTGTVRFIIEHRAKATPETTGTEVANTSDIIASSSGATQSGFSDATIPADRWLTYVCEGTIASSPNRLYVTIEYQEDDPT
jgi:hypothetical protein